MKYLLILFLLLVAVRPFPATAAPQATIVVNSLADDLAVNGDCTLREALRAAALNVVYDGCAAGGSGDPDLIVFNVDGTINLALGEYIISSPVTIRGNGRDQTIIDAGGDSLIMRLEDSPVKLESLTLQNGDHFNFGGAIYGPSPDNLPREALERM